MEHTEFKEAFFPTGNALFFFFKKKSFLLLSSLSFPSFPCPEQCRGRPTMFTCVKDSRPVAKDTPAFGFERHAVGWDSHHIQRTRTRDELCTVLWRKLPIFSCLENRIVRDRLRDTTPLGGIIVLHTRRSLSGGRETTHSWVREGHRAYSCGPCRLYSTAPLPIGDHHPFPMQLLKKTA